MAHTYEELKKKTIEDLREIAKEIEHDAVKGFTQMNKEHLLPAICKALGIEFHKHPHHAATGIDKTKLKAGCTSSGREGEGRGGGRQRPAEGHPARVPPPQPEDPGGDSLARAQRGPIEPGPRGASAVTGAEGGCSGRPDEGRPGGSLGPDQRSLGMTERRIPRAPAAKALGMTSGGSRLFLVQRQWA